MYLLFFVFVFAFYNFVQPLAISFNKRYIKLFKSADIDQTKNGRVCWHTATRLEEEEEEEQEEQEEKEEQEQEEQEQERDEEEEWPNQRVTVLF